MARVVCLGELLVHVLRFTSFRSKIVGDHYDKPSAYKPSRNCPVCGERVSWKMYVFRGSFSKWPCGRCGSILGFEVLRRMSIAGALAGVVFLSGMHFYDLISVGPPTPVWLMSVSLFVFILLERVKVVRVGDRHYCPNCQYDLRGTPIGKQVNCPECGSRTNYIRSEARYKLPDGQASDSV